MYRFPTSSRAPGRRADWLLWRCRPAPLPRIPSAFSGRIAASLPTRPHCFPRFLWPGASCRWRPLSNRTPCSRRSNPRSFHTAALFGVAVRVKSVSVHIQQFISYPNAEEKKLNLKFCLNLLHLKKYLIFRKIIFEKAACRYRTYISLWWKSYFD